MDGKNVVCTSANSVGPVMARNTCLEGTVSFQESFNVEVVDISKRKMCTIPAAAPAVTNFRRDSFDQSDLLDTDGYNPSPDGNFQAGWKQKNTKNIFGSSVNKPTNGLLTAYRPMLYNHEMEDCRISQQPSETCDLQPQAFKNRADTTRRSINSDSNSSNFDPIDGDDVSMVKDEEVANKNSSEPISCSVCGDTVAGFHCGAYVCEACKKFFVRCLKQDAGLRFTCAHNKSCEITKETRTQCPCCRFQKCLKLGMYRPGGPNVSSEIGHIPCKVCGAPSSGFHFGAITCEGCKGFFRRTVKERDSLKYQCSRNSSCVITWKTRNICKMCRYRQCLKAGMKPDKSRIGRQPNSVKHATMLELNQIKSAKGLALLPFPVQEFKSEPEDFVDGGNCRGVVPLASDSNQLATTMTPSKTLIAQCDSVEGNQKNNFMDVESLENGSRLKTESPEENHEDRPRCGTYAYEYSDVDLYKVCGKKYPVAVPAPLSAELYAVKHSQHTTLTTTEFNEFVTDPQNGNDLCKSFNLATRDRDVFHKKFHPLDNGMVNVTYTDIPPTIPVMKPISPVEKPSSPLPNYDAVISTIQHSYKDLSVILSRSDGEVITAASTMLSTWDNMMSQFAHCAQATLKFAKKVPGFRKFAISEQIHMVQSSMFPIVVVVLSLIYDEQNERFCYFMYSHEEMCHILKKFEPFQLLVPALHHMGRKICQLGLDPTEVAFLCALHLMDSGNKLTYKELLLDSLEEYIKRKFGQVCDRNGQILLCLRDMVTTNHIHQQAVNALLSEGSKYSDLEIPQLFKESFIVMDD